ncbi:DegV family protein [Mycoplasmopsis primatum]|uniref:DegV family protein n=1 Tax=Mycoplasmopsis primatum TaxID=55604 RepID=UPI000495C706|nr:DegV family protein [Mycoplasmopsis primatum]
MKYAIVVDSSIGLTKYETEKLGWYFLPLNINIDGTNYADGVDITPKTLFEKFNLKSDVKTSMFNMKEAIDLFTKLSNEVDRIFVYPISTHLSNTCDTLTAMRNDFPKLRVIRSKQISVPLLFDAIWLDSKLKSEPEKADQFVETIEKATWNNSVTLIPKHNRYLVKGGRLHPAAAGIARLLKLVPLIRWFDGQLLKEGIGRNFEKSILKNAQDKVKNFKLEKDFTMIPIIIQSGVDSHDLEQYSNTIKDLTNISPWVFDIPPVVAMHTGPESYVLGLMSFPTNTVDYLKNKIKLLQSIK